MLADNITTRLASRPILRWSQAGRGAATTLEASTNTIMDLRTLAHGRLVFGSWTLPSESSMLTAAEYWHEARKPSIIGAVTPRCACPTTAALSSSPLISRPLTTVTNRHLARLYLTEGRVLYDPQPLATGVAQVQQRLAELGYDLIRQTGLWDHVPALPFRRSSGLAVWRWTATPVQRCNAPLALSSWRHHAPQDWTSATGTTTLGPRWTATAAA